ncbi:MAG: hypothetical protein ACYCWE_19715 [Eubacteriales bacterium]
MKKGLLCIFLVFMIAITIMPSVTAADDRGLAVFIYQPVEDAIGEGDQAMINHIQSLGFTVKPVIDSECTTASADGAALLVIFESCSSANVKEKFAKIEAPIFCFEMAAWEDLGFGSQIGAVGDVFPAVFNGKNEIETALSSKSFDLYKEAATCIVMDPATVSPDAILVGLNDEGNPLIAAYDKGAALIDGSAATSRRASGFVFGQTATLLTAQALELMTAVVNWLSPIPVVETVAETSAAVPVIEETPAETVTPAAQTSDVMLSAVLFGAAAIAAILAAKKR